MKERKISILAIQETHLSPEHEADLARLYTRLLVINSAHENATSTAGIAIVVNKDHIAKIDDIKSWEIIPGRALAVRVTWKDQFLFIVGIYGTNDKVTSEKMWLDVESWLSQNTQEFPRIDVLLGDLNFVEDELDRAPVRMIPVDDARHTFQRVKNAHRLTDGWRKWNPTQLEWTWRRPNCFERSRIDRIYLSESWLDESRDWTTDQAMSGTDHYMVTADLTNNLCPEVGRGRWAMPNSVVDDKGFKERLKPLARAMAAEVARLRDAGREPGRNIQNVMLEFKRAVAITARESSKAIGSTAKRKIEALDQERLRTQNDKELDEESRKSRVQTLEASIAEQRAKQGRQRSDQTTTKEWVDGDDSNAYFHKKGRPHKPRDTIKSLKKLSAGEPSWESHSPAMAGIAKQFYEQLQTADTDVDAEKRDDAIDAALNHVNRHLSEDQSRDLGAEMDRDLIALSLRESKNNSAPGTDGLPYEFWKMMAQEFENSKNTDEPWPDIVQILTWLYNDIEKHGVDASTEFTKGWLCPLYKKGNKDEISNYRPITLLNTDYKLYTKALAIRLASAAPFLIKDDQAGFMKGRSITDQCKLAKLMVNWGEATSTNGAIVCLDQEKAYDRIRHDYLLLTLGAFNLPASFIKTVKSLYEHAETEVILNGFRSETFRVTRGVRQGDPLSCLLFNLAIEPLAEMIRKSNLQGFKIPGAEQKLIISLFADDTCVFVSEKDDLQTLQTILDTWCLASGAKFNIKKTEVVPIGTAKFRADLISSRRMRPNGPTFPDGAKIANQGEAVRLLGVYIGNGVDQSGPWESTIDKINKALSSWSMTTLSMTGKAIVTRSIVAGMTQYLGMVQGMPLDIQNRITNMVMDFIWPEGRKKAYISAGRLRAPVIDGGKGLTDFHLAEKSRQLVWLERMLLPKTSRHRWVDVAEDMMKINICPDDERGTIPLAARVSPFLQQWHPNRNTTCPDLIRIVDIAKEVGLHIDARYIPNEVKKKMPFWLHLGRRPADSTLGNRTSQCDDEAICLQTKHGILTMGDAIDAISHWELALHRPNGRRSCDCDECDHVKQRGCASPRSCYRKLLAVLREIAPRWDPRVHPEVDILAPTDEERARNAAIWSKPENSPRLDKIAVFDRSPSHGTDIADYVRVFTKSLRTDEFRSVTHDMRQQAQPRPSMRGPVQRHTTISIATEIINANGDDANCGVAASFSDRNIQSIQFRLQDEWAHAELATLLCASRAIHCVETTTPIELQINSIVVLQRLTKDLRKHEAAGWSSVPRFQSQYRDLANSLHAWEARVTIAVDRSSATSQSALQAAHSALQLTRAEVPTRIANNSRDVAGASLRGLTQNGALRILRSKVNVPQRRSTFINLGRIRCAVAEVNGKWPTEQEIWKSTRSKDIYRPTREFIWRLIHGTQKVGAFWFNVQNREMLSECPPCETTESMDHILLECDAPGQEIVWREAKDLWNRTGLRWPDLSLGLIMGCATVEIRDTNGKCNRGASRLFRIIVSESAFLIWKLRNERRIQRRDEDSEFHIEQEIIGRWRAIMERRFRIDTQWSNTRKFKKRALDFTLLKATWENILLPRQQDGAPRNWWAGPELLVSIWPSRPRGRER